MGRSAGFAPLRILSTSALAAELVAAGVDVIVVNGNQAILAAKSVTTTIPIVVPWVLAPVETGIVTSLARPGGNVTGLTGRRVQTKAARNFSSSSS
jgi:putative ABC transport system substrate-binding protein